MLTRAASRPDQTMWGRAAGAVDGARLSPRRLGGGGGVALVLVAGATEGGGAETGRAGLGGGVDFRATGAGVSRRTLGGEAVSGVRTPDGGMLSARVVTPSGSSKTS